jgi:F0F1-type ATP synthase assembly protein I
MSHPLVQRYRLVMRVVVLQAGIALLAGIAFLVLKGSGAGLAALIGGLIVASGTALFGWRMFAPGIAGGATLTRAMFAAAAMKWVWFIAALYVALARCRLDAAPLLVGLVAAQFGHWAALVRVKITS